MVVIEIILSTAHSSTIALPTRQVATEPVTATMRHTLRRRVSNSIGTSLMWRGTHRGGGRGNDRANTDYHNKSTLLGGRNIKKENVWGRNSLCLHYPPTPVTSTRVYFGYLLAMSWVFSLQAPFGLPRQ